MNGFDIPSLQSMLGRSQAQAQLFPPADAIRLGEEMAKYNKYPVDVTDYRVRVFDMSSESDRAEYESVMKDLFKKVQASRCVICRQELQVFGDSWKRYLEWFEYRPNETSTTSNANPAERSGEKPQGDQK